MHKQLIALLAICFAPVVGRADATAEVLENCSPKKMGYYERIDLVSKEGKLFLSLTARPTRPLGSLEVTVSRSGRSRTYLATDPAEQNFSLEIPFVGEISFVRYDYRGGVVAHEFSCTTVGPKTALSPE